MEAATNGTLDSFIQYMKLYKDKEAIVRIYMAQMINFAEYMQQQGIMHRDIKPINIMLDSNHNIKVIDFGTAKRIDEVDLENFDRERSESLYDEMARPMRYREEGTFVGTPNYMAPEVIK